MQTINQFRTTSYLRVADYETTLRWLLFPSSAVMTSISSAPSVDQRLIICFCTLFTWVLFSAVSLSWVQGGVSCEGEETSLCRKGSGQTLRTPAGESKDIKLILKVAGVLQDHLLSFTGWYLSALKSHVPHFVFWFHILCQLVDMCDMHLIFVFVFQV